MLRLLLSFAFLISPTASFDLATVQTPTAGAARPAPPTRDPSAPGYVIAKELPDGAIPSAKEDGNFIIGSSVLTSSGAAAKFKFWPNWRLTPHVITPATFPFKPRSGPPLFPWETGAVV